MELHYLQPMDQTIINMNQLFYGHNQRRDRWQISTTVYNSVNYTDGTVDMEGLTFKSDGSAFYVIDDIINTVIKYDLTTNWDLSGGITKSSDLFLLTNTTRGRSIYITPDGIHMYITDYTGTVSCDHYTMSTPWLLTSATYSDQFISPTSVIYSPFVTNDGLLMFLTEINGDVRKYNLSTPYNASSATLIATEFRASGWSTTASGWNPNGLQLFSINNNILNIDQFDFTTPFEISNLAISDDTYDLSTPIVISFGLFFKPDGTRYWVVDSSVNTVYQFDLA